jgi:hypothetical protein
MGNKDRVKNVQDVGIEDILKGNLTSENVYWPPVIRFKKLRNFLVVRSRRVYHVDGKLVALQRGAITSVLPDQAVVLRLGPISVIVRAAYPKKMH